MRTMRSFTAQPHVHGLFLLREKIKPVKLAKELSKRFPSFDDGTKPVHIRTCGTTPDDLARLASYLLKVPHGGSAQIKSNKRNENGEIVESQYSRKRPDAAARNIIYSRQAEILSRSDIRNLIVSGGHGVRLKNDLLRVLSCCAAVSASQVPKTFDLERTDKFWCHCRRDKVGRRYPAPKIRNKRGEP